ncbi:uncharacterized protein LOC134626614 isoform X1 [Pelmatolapia mariae]|uniref:uncharacterized protein LOC134626614 isoform X1 n=1 Tax=Pelmatolapia mariae TaxID=158779 RepID=UPI002FE64FA4
MISWLVLRGSRAGGSVCPSTAAPGSGGSSCLSRERADLQQLNRRLASYLQQVEHLEAANQMLEHQIEEELDRKCPRELRWLDGHLRTASLLQGQISECLSAQAQAKLQLLEAELTVFDLKERCQKVREQRTHLEAELSDLGLLGEVLKVHSLPELQNLLNEQKQEKADLQTQHQQDMQVLLAQISGGVTAEMHITESSDLIQQVDHLRQTSVGHLDKNKSKPRCKTELSMQSISQVTFDPSLGSDADRAELEAMRREVCCLTAELTRLQAAVLVLESSGREQKESLLQHLVVLQESADGLCRDLDSVLQAAAQQAADHQSLLDVKNQLGAEIQDYKQLLDSVDRQGVSHVDFNSKPDVRSSCLETRKPTFRSNKMVNRTVSVQGGRIHTLEQTPIVSPKTATAAQSDFVHNKHPNNSPRTPTKPLMETIQNSENQRTVVLYKKVGKSIISTETGSRQRSPVEDKVHTKDHDVGAQTSRDVRALVKTSKTGVITALVPDSIDAFQTKQETFTSKQAGSLSTDRGTDMETNKNTPSAGPDVIQKPHFVMYETSFHLCKPVAVEVKVREALIYTQMDPIEASFQAKEKDPTKIIIREAETHPEAVRDMDENVSTPHKPPGSPPVFRSSKVQSDVWGEVALMKETDKGTNERSVNQTVDTEDVQILDQSLGLSKTELNKLIEDKPAVHDNEHFLSSISEINNKLHSKTTSAENLKEEVDKVEELHDCKEVKMNHLKSENELINLQSQEIYFSATNSEMSISLTDSGVALSSSSPEEPQSPREEESMSPTKPDACLNPEKCSMKSSTEPEPYLTPNDPHICLNPTEDMTEVDDGLVDRKEEAEDTLIVLSLDKSLTNMSNNKLVKDADSWTSVAISSPESKENKKCYIQHTDSLKAEVDEMKTVNNASEVKLDPVESKKKTSDLSGEEASNISTSLTDSGVGLSCSSYEELQSPKEVHLSVGETNSPSCLSPKICVSPDETEVMLNLTDQVFCPVDVEDQIASPDLRPSPNDPENYLSPNDSDICLNPDSDEKEEAGSLNLTEANARVHPGEKVILSTKEDGQSVSFSGDGSLPEDRGTRVIMSEGNRGVLFRPFKGYEGRGVNLNGTKISSRPTSQRSSLQVSSSHGGSVFGDRRSIIADREEQLGFGGLYRRRDARRSRGKDVSGPADEDKIGGVTMNRGMRGQRNSDWQVKNQTGNAEEASFGNTLSTRGMTSSKPGGFSNSGDAQVGTAGVKGRFSGDSMVYGGCLGHMSVSLPNSGSKEHLPEEGRFGSRGWMVYGDSLRRKNSLDAGTSLPNERGGENSSINGNLATSPPEAGRFGRRWIGEWIFDGGSLGRKNSWAGSDSSLSAESKERLSPATTPPGAGIFSRGEWKVYGWHAGCMSSDSKDCPSAATHIATSPPGTPGAGRFSSGEWTVYCGSPGRVSRADSADRVSVSSSQMVSPPSSYASSGRRLNSAGSGGRLSSASVVRRSSSVGRFTGTGSGGWKPVYSSASGHSVGSAGWGGEERTTNRQRAPSPGRRIGGSGGWLSSSKAAGNQISGAGSGSKVAGSSDRLSSHAGGRISSSGRTNNTGGRVISSSDRPIRSTGSQAGRSKEKISVCKMAALTISAAGRERSQERQRQAQRARQPRQQQQRQQP